MDEPGGTDEPGCGDEPGDIEDPEDPDQPGGGDQPGDVDEPDDGSDEPVYSEGLEYTLMGDEEYYVVSGIGECTDAHLVIPRTYNDLPVTSIRSSAFSGCTGLTSVTFEGTMAEWNAITKGYVWYWNSPLRYVECSDGTVSV